MYVNRQTHSLKSHNLKRVYENLTSEKNHMSMYVIILQKSKYNPLLQLFKLNFVLAYFSTDLFLLMQNNIVKDNERKIYAMKIKKIAHYHCMRQITFSMGYINSPCTIQRIWIKFWVTR